jgi:hypothetical protein
MCSLRFENNFLSSEGVRFASISKKTLLSKISFAFVSLALPLLVPTTFEYCETPFWILVNWFQLFTVGTVPKFATGTVPKEVGKMLIIVTRILVGHKIIFCSSYGIH